MRLTVPISVGEFFDKLGILRLKRERLRDAGARAEARREYDALSALKPDLVQLAPLIEALDQVNAKLWNAEDRIRGCEVSQDFGADFVALSRSIYTLNDERAALKRQINIASGSDFVEQKSYG